MAVSEEFLQYVRDQLRELGAVTTRKMFGGAGIYFDGKFFALVDDDELYFKVDDATRPRFEEAGCHAFEPWAGQFMNGYWSVPADVLEDSAAIADWAREAVGVARKSSKPERQSKPARKRKPG